MYMDINDLALQLHKKFSGKIATTLRDSPDTREKLSAYYSPGVAAVSKLTAAYPEQMRDYTWTNNLVAVISDGSAVLGLGNIGPYGACRLWKARLCCLSILPISTVCQLC